MTYCPWTGHVVLKTGGMVFLVKLLSLKHRVPRNISGVLETYSENPKKVSASKNLNPRKKRHDINWSTYVDLLYDIVYTATTYIHTYTSDVWKHHFMSKAVNCTQKSHWKLLKEIRYWDINGQKGKKNGQFGKSNSLSNMYCW